jgi:putative flippase GtrA
MPPTAPLKLRDTSRQLILFGIIGGVQLCVDWACFVTLTWLGLAVIPANLCGRITGAAIGFVLNGRHTFAESGRNNLGRAQATKFILFWCVMSLLSTYAVWLAEQIFGLDGARAAKPVIDAALAGLGFISSKLWIYR